MTTRIAFEARPGEGHDGEVKGASTVSVRTRPLYRGQKATIACGDTRLYLEVVYIDSADTRPIVYVSATQEQLKQLVDAGWDEVR